MTSTHSLPGSNYPIKVDEFCCTGPRPINGFTRRNYTESIESSKPQLVFLDTLDDNTDDCLRSPAVDFSAVAAPGDTDRDESPLGRVERRNCHSHRPLLLRREPKYVEKTGSRPIFIFSVFINE